MLVVAAPLVAPAPGAPVDVVPFGTLMPGNLGVVWDDPREIHRVVFRFQGTPPPADRVRLEYWSSRWPEQRLPKDREPGGGDVGWWELGNWYTGEWRTADAAAKADGSNLLFTFRPVNVREFPSVGDYPAEFRYTLKIRLASDQPLPPVQGVAAYTDSVWQAQGVRVAWRDTSVGPPDLTAFNGAVLSVDGAANAWQAGLLVCGNPDPNTFDRTLVTVTRGKAAFTFAPGDLSRGPLYLPSQGAVVLPAQDTRDYAAVEAAEKAAGQKTLYDRVAALPEQTWQAAWKGIPPKRSPIYLPLGLDGGRQRFGLESDGGVFFRTNDHFLTGRPGAETPRLAWEPPSVRVRFGLPKRFDERTIEDASLPVCRTVWRVDGARVEQTALVTHLDGARRDEPVPPADALAVFLARFVFTNPTAGPVTTGLSLELVPGEKPRALRAEAGGMLWSGDRLRMQVVGGGLPRVEQGRLRWSWTLRPGEKRTVVAKLPYVPLDGETERAALGRLAFAREHAAVSGYWRRRLDEGTRLATPEPMLNEFYRAHAGHLLVNCEREPGSDRRFARVGSFGYGAYGNESCMMVVDLDRRGYHKEAQDCLDAWLHYQGTVGLPGDFSSHDGVLYGAGGYEAGGYNQHHGWILWCMAEHYRFTRDTAWLRRAAPGIVAGADWIVRERARTADRTDLARGLLPAGSLEDIGDWWPWLSTNCYTWRGIDSAAWALEQIRHPEAARLRKEADAYHAALLSAFREAGRRAPVVRLRDGTAVPHIPSYVYRRGRCFGWICETLEGALHLLITRALDARSPEAEAILKDYEDNLYLSNQYGYTVPDFDRQWFGLGGMSMQACLLLDVEPYLYRDDVKHALRALFNGIAVGYFPDVRMLTEHALPNPGDWRGDHYKSSDEANAAGWLRYLFVREEDDSLLLGQAVPREWLADGRRCGVEHAATWFGPVSLLYQGGKDRVTARLRGPRRNPPGTIRLRFREPDGRPLLGVTVNGKAWKDFEGEWVRLPGDIGDATVVARWRAPRA